MALTFFQAVLARQRQRLEKVILSPAKVQLNAVEKVQREKLGRALARARELAGLTQKELAGKFGHSDSAMLSRWERGTERPHLDAYFAVTDDAGRFFMRKPVVIAFAALAEGGVEIHTTISLSEAVGQ